MPKRQITNDFPQYAQEFFEEAARNPFLLEALPCGAFLVRDDADLTLIRGNSRFFELFGCTPEEMASRYANRTGALAAVEAVNEITEWAKSEEVKPASFRHRVKRAGEDAWIFTRASRFRYQDGWAFFCVAFDITQQERDIQVSRQYAEDVNLVRRQVGVDVFGYDLNSGNAWIYSAHNFLPAQPKSDDGGQFVLEAILNREMVHPECAEIFQGAFDAIRGGESRTVCDLRMKDRGGKYVWVRLTLAMQTKGVRAGCYAIGMLENINQQKELSIQYLNETQFYQAMLSEKTAFAQADLTEDRFTRFGGMWNLYYEVMDTMTYSELFEEFINKVVHPDDRKHYLELVRRENFIQSLDNGINRLGCEFRRIVDQNKMMWMELSVHLFREPITRHVMALAYITNIDSRKKQEIALLRDSERDALTNMYNKKTAEAAIRDYLKHMARNEACAFMILDMDDFKYINDAYGHKMGDRALVRLAEILGRVFRSNDIIGRFGGDEFIIFLKNINSEKKAGERLESLYERLKKENDPELSCSIGISMVRYGDSYEHVFRQADVALYNAKNKEKGSYAFFGGNTGQILPPSPDYRRLDTPVEPQIMEQAASDEVTFDSFLAEQGDIAYLVNPDTYTLLCGNKAFYDRIGRTEDECIGIKCYEAMHKRESPCPFCSKANWATDKFYLWKNMNEALEQEFLIKNKLVKWREQEALLAIAVDISNNKSIVDSMENGATESHSILSGVQHMTEAATLADAMVSALETIGYFFRAGAVRFWERKNPDTPYRPSLSWTRVHQDQDYDVSGVDAWIQSRQWDQPIMVECPEDMLCYSYEMYQYMRNNGLVNQRWIQLRDGKQELGYLAVENISSNFQSVAFLESFTVFMESEIKKRSLMENVIYSNEHDDLTGLLSRNSFELFLDRYNGDCVPQVGVMVANFDNLKKINSIRGFSEGNRCLKQFADMLKMCFPNFSIFRLNGDEFMVIAIDIDRMGLETAVQKLKNMAEQEGTFIVSIGYSWDNLENDLALLIDQSTEAMRVEKRRHYDANPISVDTERRKMLSELMASLENREFEVYLQPKVELAYNKVVGAEALIRYRHKDKNIVTPDKFIHVLERNNMIRYIDLFVFEEVCRVLKEWQEKGVALPIISLNFSRLTLLERDILSSMKQIIARYDVPRRNVEVEITESMASMGKSILYQAARELYDAGFNISLDDFGTKYTNLSILADIDFSMLKLDRSLVGSLENQSNNQIILKNIIYMCQDLGIDVIAEGVETQDQEDLLRSLKCKLGQGYLYGKPMPIEEFEKKYMGL